METKRETYEALMPQIEALVSGETDLIANMANVAAVLHEAFGFWWTGFYRVTGEGLQVTGKGLQVTGEGLQVTGEGLQVTGYRERVTGYRERVTGVGFRTFSGTDGMYTYSLREGRMRNSMAAG